MKRITILSLLIGTVLGLAFTQYNSPQRNRTILVIPFSRFEFHTEIKLSKINEANKLTGDQFYPLLISSFSEAFELNSTERVTYKNISELDLKDIGPYLKYDLIGSKGHYTCNLDSLNKQTLKEILDKYECDYLLTINWYRIISDKTSYKQKGIKKITLYSSHFIDYDYFTREGTLINQDSRVKIEVKANSSNAQYMGLRLEDLKPEFKNLVDEITLNLTGSN